MQYNHVIISLIENRTGYLPETQKKVLYTIIGTNVAVFLLWNTYDIHFIHSLIIISMTETM